MSSNSPGAKFHILEFKAGDLDGEDALQHQVERHRGALRQRLIEGDLEGEVDAGAVLGQDGERFHADVVDGYRLRTSV